jgi:hypothetical protein
VLSLEAAAEHEHLRTAEPVAVGVGAGASDEVVVNGATSRRRFARTKERE